MAFDDSLWRMGAAADLAVQSAGGAAVSTAVFGSETYAVQMTFVAPVSSTVGIRVKVINVGDPAVSSTGDALLPPSWVFNTKVTPGQRISAISNDALTPTLSIVQLTK